MTIPAMTDFFSDPLDVQTLDVSPYSEDGGGSSVLTFNQPHRLEIGQHSGICITDMAVPNTIIAIERLADDPEFIKLTTGFEHDLTEDPELTALLTGFIDPNFNGELKIFGIDSPNQFHIQLPETVPLPVLTGTEILLEQLEGELTGWHRVIALNDSQLSFVTPAGVSRSYRVVAPKAVKNIRIWGEMTFAKVLDNWQRAADNKIDEAPGLFVVPLPETRMSRSRDSNTDAITEFNEGQDIHLTLLDGFDIFACFPLGEGKISRIELVDFCNAWLERTLRLTFFGLKLPRPEMTACLSEHKMISFSGHGPVHDSDAFYIHKYSYQQPTMLRSGDVILANNFPDFSPGGDSLRPQGTRAMRDITFNLTATQQGAIPIIKAE